MNPDNLLHSIRDAQRQLTVLDDAPDTDPRVLDALTSIAQDFDNLDAHLSNAGDSPDSGSKGAAPPAPARDQADRAAVRHDRRRRPGQRPPSRDSSPTAPRWELRLADPATPERRRRDDHRVSPRHTPRDRKRTRRDPKP